MPQNIQHDRSYEDDDLDLFDDDGDDRELRNFCATVSGLSHGDENRDANNRWSRITAEPVEANSDFAGNPPVSSNAVRTESTSSSEIDESLYNIPMIRIVLEEVERARARAQAIDDDVVDYQKENYQKKLSIKKKQKKQKQKKQTKQKKQKKQKH